MLALVSIYSVYGRTNALRIIFVVQLFCMRCGSKNVKYIYTTEHTTNIIKIVCWLGSLCNVNNDGLGMCYVLHSFTVQLNRFFFV